MISSALSAPAKASRRRQWPSSKSAERRERGTETSDQKLRYQKPGRALLALRDRPGGAKFVTSTRVDGLGDSSQPPARGDAASVSLFLVPRSPCAILPTSYESLPLLLLLSIGCCRPGRQHPKRRHAITGAPRKRDGGRQHVPDQQHSKRYPGSPGPRPRCHH
jgi:hypothetical protein